MEVPVAEIVLLDLIEQGKILLADIATQDVQPIVEGLRTPSGVAISPDGTLVFGDSEDGIVYRLRDVGCLYDLDGDGQIGLGDLAILLSNYGESGMTYDDGDFTGDGYVGLDDLAALLGEYGTDCP